MNQRDLELLSSYLDGQLSPSDISRLEARLKTDPQLVSVLNDLRATRSLLRKLPIRKAPRNFTLTRKMVGQNPPLPRSYPFFRLATALATLLFVFSFGLNAVGRYVAHPAYGFGGGGGGASDSQFYSATEPPAAAQAPLAPLPTETAPAIANGAPVIGTPMTKSAGDSAAATAESQERLTPPEAQSPAPWIPSAWQIGLAVVAILSALLLFLMRQMAISRWRK